jgi:hypothetical protein
LDNILNIPDNNGVIRNLITQYGMLTIQNVKDNASQYQTVVERRSQNAQMIYQLLIGSIESDFKLKVLLHKHDYTINGVRNGPLLLKTMIMSTKSIQELPVCIPGTHSLT